MPADFEADQAAFSKQYDAEQATKAASDTQQDQAPPSLLQRFGSSVSRVTGPMLDSAVSEAEAWGTAAKHVGQDVAAGAITGATNIVDAAHSGLVSAARNVKFYPGDPGPSPDAQDPIGPIWAHAKASILDFRDAVAVKDPNMIDGLTQGVAQLAIPFAGYSRALSGLHGFANLVAAGAATDATALGPHDMRIADLISLGRTAEGKLGDALRKLSPDGGAVNAYINYLTDRGNESEAEGRFKNVLDGFGMNLIATPLIHAAATALKQGTVGLRFMVDNGVGSSGGLAPRAAQVGAVGDLKARPPLQQGADPAEALYEAQVKRDADAAAANPNGKRPPLVQGVDSAEAIYADKVRQDAENGAPMAAPKDATQVGGYAPLEAIPAVTSFRKVLQSRAGSVDPLGDAAKGTATPVSVGTMATTLASYLPEDGAEGSFYKDVLTRVAARNPESRLFVNSKPHVDGRLGQFDLATGDVQLFPRSLQDNQGVIHTFAHEAVHAAVFKDIERNPITRNTLDDLRKQVDDPIQRYNTAASKAWKESGFSGDPGYKISHYGTTNVQEFVAEAESNPAFRKVLQRTPAKDGRSVWENYKDTIAGILGIGGAVAASPLFDQLLTKKEEKNGA